MEKEINSVELPTIEQQQPEHNSSNEGKINWRSSSILIFLWLVSLLLIVPTVVPHGIDVKEGSPSPDSIYASRTIIDRFTTEILRKDAMDKAPVVMYNDPKISIQAQSELNSFMDQVSQLNDRYSDLETRQNEIGKKIPVNWSISASTLRGLAQQSKAQNEHMRQVLIDIIKERYQEEINANNLRVHRELAEEQLVERLTDDNITARDLLYQLLQINYVVDLSTTELARNAAAEMVEPKRVLQGERILAMGDIVTEREIMLLQDLGLLNVNLNMELVLAVTGALLGLVFMLYALIYLITPELLQEPRKIMVLSLLICLALVIGRVIIYGMPEQAVLVPIPAMTLVVAILFSMPLAIAFGVILSLICSLYFGGDTTIIQVFLIGSLAAIFGSRKLRERTDLLVIGFRIGVAQALVIFFNDFIYLGFHASIWFNTLWGLISGIIAGFIALGLLPFLEVAFNLISSLKLLELGNSNHPLLRKLLMEAPGSYQHSIMVANLAEIVCDEIGADALLARVGATFHDVGKCKRPIYFVENHMTSDNPHDQLRPLVSASILFSHVSDGLELGKEYNLPEQILQFIRSHHGTTEAAFFLRKAQQEAPEGTEINLADFRYLGPKPPNREVAIVMLADTCEAAVRSLKEPSEVNIANTVERICRDRLNSGQLDDSDLTIRDLTKAMQTIIKTLTSVYHRRIQYPSDPTPESKTNQDQTKKEVGN